MSRYAYHADTEVFSTFDAAHAQGQYPNRWRSGLRIGGPRWAALLRIWCQKNSVVYRESRSVQTRRERSKAPGRIDMSKPAFAAAGLAPAPKPVPERPGAPRTPEQIAAFKQAELAAEIERSIRAYDHSHWRRPLKSAKAKRQHVARDPTKNDGRLRIKMRGLKSEESWREPVEVKGNEWRQSYE